MERITRFRARIVMLLFVAVLGFFAFYLYNLQIIETGGNTDNTSTFSVMTRVKAARGDILDRNGNVLVSNRASYDLVLIHYVINSADGTNDYLLRLVECCEKQDVAYAEHLPVSMEHPFVYTTEELNGTWQRYFQVFLSNMGNVDSDITAPVLMDSLRKHYDIPEDWSDHDARRVIGLRYELDLRGLVQSLPSYVFLTDVSDELLSEIMELSVPGLNVEASTVREYNTSYAAHILGYVGAMSDAQWEQYKGNPDYSMDSEIGQSGFEAAFEEYLHGVDAWRIDEVTADGTVVDSYYLDDIEPRAGSNVEVAIDINLQMTAEDKLAEVIETLRAKADIVPEPGQTVDTDGSHAEGGAVVAMDVKTGQVLVCGSYPTYDPARIFEDWDEIVAIPYSALYNRALIGTYPPGSTYKMSMVTAGFKTRIIDSKTEIEDKGVYDKYDDIVVKCLYYSTWGEGHEHVTPSVALMVSCNYFFYELADRLKIAVIDEVAKGYGLGEPTGIEIPEEIGHRANPETKKELYEANNGWYPADQILTGIGQSDNLFTPLQLCVYTATLANQGTRNRATFLNRVVSADYRNLVYESKQEVLSHMEVSDEAYMAILEGMLGVTGNSRGTAYLTFKDYPIAVAAKTGTAQTSNLAIEDNGAFVCFAPADDPQIAIAVYGEKAGHGSSMAAVAKAILDVYFDVDEVGEVTVYENQLS